MDLSQSFGYPGNPGVQEVQDAVNHIIEVAAKYQKPLGIFVGTPEAGKAYKESCSFGAAFFSLYLVVSWLPAFYTDRRG